METINEAMSVSNPINDKCAVQYDEYKYCKHRQHHNNLITVTFYYFTPKLFFKFFFRFWILTLFTLQLSQHAVEFARYYFSRKLDPIFFIFLLLLLFFLVGVSIFLRFLYPNRFHNFHSNSNSDSNSNNRSSVYCSPDQYWNTSISVGESLKRNCTVPNKMSSKASIFRSIVQSRKTCRRFQPGRIIPETVKEDVLRSTLVRIGKTMIWHHRNL